MIGGLGGFLLPLTFGMLNDLTGIWSSCFMLLFVLVMIALTWMHFSVVRMERRVVPELATSFDRFAGIESSFFIGID